DVQCGLEEKGTRRRDRDHLAEVVPGDLGNGDAAPEQYYLCDHEANHPHEPEHAAGMREDEVGLRHADEVERALCSAANAFPEEAAGADCDAGLDDLVSLF